MFVSQVSFESEKENEPRLKTIMRRKLAGIKDVAGLVSAECWRQEKGEAVGYTLVTKWRAKADFSAWMAGEHKGRSGRQNETPGNRPTVRKTGCQYEVVAPEELDT